MAKIVEDILVLFLQVDFFSFLSALLNEPLVVSGHPSQHILSELVCFQEFPIVDLVIRVVKSESLNEGALSWVAANSPLAEFLAIIKT